MFIKVEIDERIMATIINARQGMGLRNDPIPEVIQKVLEYYADACVNLGYERIENIKKAYGVLDCLGLLRGFNEKGEWKIKSVL